MTFKIGDKVMIIDPKSEHVDKCGIITDAEDNMVFVRLSEVPKQGGFYYTSSIILTSFKLIFLRQFNELYI